MINNGHLNSGIGCKWAATQLLYFCPNGKFFNDAFVVKGTITR